MGTAGEGAKPRSQQLQEATTTLCPGGVNRVTGNTESCVMEKELADKSYGVGRETRVGI